MGKYGLLGEKLGHSFSPQIHSLLCGYEAEALSQLEIMEMDNGIACESVDAYTGKCRTGAAFATCAGFLCHSMYLACREVEHEN